MKPNAQAVLPHVAETDWIPFPGGELEAPRPKVLCTACREQLQRGVNARQTMRSADSPVSSGAAAGSSRPQTLLCFACYRAQMVREAALKAAGELDTASDARFQSILPLEPVDQSRLTRLRAARASARAIDSEGRGRFVDRRRQAQIAARHALQQIAAGLRRHQAAQSIAQPAASYAAAAAAASAVARPSFSSAENQPTRVGEVWASVHAAELQLPETWLPFVVAR